MTDRRGFLAIAGGFLGATLLSSRIAFAVSDDGGEPMYASCVRLDDDRYAVAVLDGSGTIRTLQPLPDRGHDVAFDPGRDICVAFARRPGTFAVVFDIAGRSAPEIITAAPGRHFYGHGLFTADGSLMFATENDIASGEGRVGIYDVRDGFRRVGEFLTGGIGPHELVWCADRRTLAIANGGLETDPAFGRRNLNVADMRSTLTLIEADGGRVLASVAAGPGLEVLSIRHLALDRRGNVWFGCQSEGNPADLPPLVGRMSPDGAVEMLELPSEARNRPRNYIGSVAVSDDGHTVAVSAPRGGVILGFDAANGRYLGLADFRDGCGLAPATGGLLATAGTGRLLQIGTVDGQLAPRAVGRADVVFDNHLAQLASSWD